MAKVLIKETGTATEGINVARTSRINRKTTRITRSMEIASVRSTSCSEARMTGVWLSIEDVESMLIEVEQYRLKYDSASRRQRDAVRVAQRRKPTGSEVMANLANQDPEDGAV